MVGKDIRSGIAPPLKHLNNCVFAHFLRRLKSWVLIFCTVPVFAEEPRLEFGSIDQNGWIKWKAGMVHSNAALSVEVSADLKNWTERFRFELPSSAGTFADADSRNDTRFYRLGRIGSRDWWTHLFRPFSWEKSWTKFVIDKTDPTRILFQDPEQFPLHYDFLKYGLGANLSRAEFDQISLHPGPSQ